MGRVLKHFSKNNFSKKNETFSSHNGIELCQLRAGLCESQIWRSLSEKYQISIFGVDAFATKIRILTLNKTRVYEIKIFQIGKKVNGYFSGYPLSIEHNRYDNK